MRNESSDDSSFGVHDAGLVQALAGAAVVLGLVLATPAAADELPDDARAAL